MIFRMAGSSARSRCLPAPPVTLCARRPPEGGTLSDQSYSDRMVRLVTIAPVAVLATLVGTQLALTAADTSGAVLVLCWLAAALRELRAAREELATRAVLRERIRIDGELAHTVGASLAEIAARGAVAADLAGTDPVAAEAELRALVNGSRRTA